MALDPASSDESDEDDAQSSIEDSKDPGDKPPRSAKDAEKIVSQAKRRFLLCEEAEGDQRRLAREDFEFRQGKQWRDQDITERGLDGRPCLVINRIPQFIHQVTNDQRQNRPSIKVHPIDDKGDVDQAKIIQGLIRHIEYRSSADTAYDRAVDGAATGGFGFFRIITEFVNHKSFDQELRIKMLRNPFAAYLDPSHQEPDGSDANYGFTWDDYQEDEYRAMYPDSELARSRDWDSLNAQAPGWIDGKTARVMEYFDRVMVPDTLLQLSDGSAILKSELPAAPGMIPPGPDGQPRTIVPGKSRATKVPKVTWFKINGLEILDETEWVSKWIPIIPVYGDEYVDPSTGKVVREGIVRNAKDSQRMYNYWTSAETETIALAPRTPWVGTEGQFEGHEEKWKTANRRNHAFLEFKPTTIAGQLAPPPQRQQFEPPVGAITQAKAMAADDLKATTGIYDASLGKQGNETSGIAIQRRNVQSQTANFHIVDNLTKSIRHAGRILVDGIPKVYDGPRASRIIGDEGDQRIVKLNQAFIEKGKPVLYDLSVGEYDVAVDTGPSFTTKRQEGAAAMLELSKSMPVINTAAPDLILKSMDVPGAQELSDRVKKTLAPGLADDDEAQQQPIPPQVQKQIQQYQQLIDQLTQHLKHKTEQIEQKTLELESRERIELAKTQAQMEIELLKVGSNEAIQLLRHQIAEIEQRQAQFLAFNQPIQDGSADGQPGGIPAATASAQPPTGGDQSPGQPMETP